MNHPSSGRPSSPEARSRRSMSGPSRKHPSKRWCDESATSRVDGLGVDPRTVNFQCRRSFARNGDSGGLHPQRNPSGCLALTLCNVGGPVMNSGEDPRSEAEKARADLMRNDAMGAAVPQSPLERQPSVTPKTFGDTTKTGQIRSGIDQGVEDGGPRPAGHGGGSESIAESEQVSSGRDHTAPRHEGSDEDVLSRGRE